jgi:trehalose 6-phosphate synthase
LSSFYRAAKVGVVTPLRDGMNLVAKEYVASQNGEDPGVLVLSEFAGAACELHGALKVNPFDREQCADAMHAALTMPLDERRQRWRSMMSALRGNDIHSWRDAFLGELERPRAPVDEREQARAISASSAHSDIRLRTRSTHSTSLTITQHPPAT